MPTSNAVTVEAPVPIIRALRWVLGKPIPQKDAAGFRSPASDFGAKTSLIPAQKATPRSCGSSIDNNPLVSKLEVHHLTQQARASRKRSFRSFAWSDVTRRRTRRHSELAFVSRCRNAACPAFGTQRPTMRFCLDADLKLDDWRILSDSSRHQTARKGVRLSWKSRRFASPGRAERRPIGNR